jgi:hypothetical protein
VACPPFVLPGLVSAEFVISKALGALRSFVSGFCLDRELRSLTSGFSPISALGLPACGRLFSVTSIHPAL